MKTDYVKVERCAVVERNKSFIRPIENVSGIYWCKICTFEANYRCVVNGYHFHLCKKCMTTFALITQNYFMPSPHEHLIYGREPDVFIYPTTETIYHLLCPYFDTRKIFTIKYLRKFTGLGLRDAKHQIDYWQAGNRGWLEDEFKDYFKEHVAENRQLVTQSINEFRQEVR